MKTSCPRRRSIRGLCIGIPGERGNKAGEAAASKMPRLWLLVPDSMLTRSVSYRLGLLPLGGGGGGGRTVVPADICGLVGRKSRPALAAASSSPGKRSSDWSLLVGDGDGIISQVSLTLYSLSHFAFLPF